MWCVHLTVIQVCEHVTSFGTSWVDKVLLLSVYNLKTWSWKNKLFSKKIVQISPKPIWFFSSGRGISLDRENRLSLRNAEKCTDFHTEFVWDRVSPNLSLKNTYDSFFVEWAWGRDDRECASLSERVVGARLEREPVLLVNQAETHLDPKMFAVSVLMDSWWNHLPQGFCGRRWSIPFH